jgi:hypothetical protein
LYTQVSALLPALKHTIRLPEDVDLLERLNNAISNSMTDGDRDVSQAARAINEAYKRVPLRLGGVGGGLGVEGGGPGAAAYEAEDRRKEAEEASCCTFSAEDTKECVCCMSIPTLGVAPPAFTFIRSACAYQRWPELAKASSMQ